MNVGADAHIRPRDDVGIVPYKYNTKQNQNLFIFCKKHVIIHLANRFHNKTIVRRRSHGSY